MADLIEARYERGGVYLPETDLWLDPHGPREKAFVSHAHADHFARHQVILCSERTFDLIRTRYSLKKQAKVIALAYGEVHALDENHEVCLLPAGHIFGSAQIHLTRLSDGATLLYTGDFKLRESFSAETIESKVADTLIMETTFGLPHFRFPPTSEVVADVVKFCREALEEGAIPIVLGYSLGKAQEILAALSGSELPIMVHKTVREMTAVYERYIDVFPNYMELDVSKAVGHVLIMPPAVARSQEIRELKNCRMAMLSGWGIQQSAKYRYRAGTIFPLSDHADYPDLKAYVAQVRPKRVLTLHGYAAEFARDLREQGIEAWSILADNQMDLDLSLATGNAQAQEESDLVEQGTRMGGGVAALSNVCEAIANSTGKQKKIEILSAYFEKLAIEDLRHSVQCLTGGAFNIAKRGLAPKAVLAMIRKALLEVSGLSVSRFREIAASQADMGRITSVVLRGVTDPEAIELAGLRRFCQAMIRAKGPLAMHALLVERLRTLDPTHASLLVCALTNDGGLGVPLELLEEALAKSFDQPVRDLRRARMLLGDLGDTAVAAKEDTLLEVALQPFTPIVCMSASPAESSGSVWDQLTDHSEQASVWLEEWHGGIRAQLHCVKGEAALFSSDMRSLDAEFPEVLAIATKDLAADVVLDGELIAYADGKILTLEDLRRRRGRKRLEGDFFFGEAAPVRYLAHDALWMNGTSLLDLTLIERRRLLGTMTWHATIKCSEIEKASSVEAIGAAYERACARGNHRRLIAKDPNSIYSPGGDSQSWLEL